MRHGDFLENYRHAVRLTALIGMGPVVGVRAEKLRVPAVVLDMYERHGAPVEKKKAVIVMSALARQDNAFIT